MATKRYIADWHYDHKNAIAFDNRPFLSVEEMNVELVKRWNSVVKPGDITYVLGDMFWCKPTIAVPVLDQLNGQIFLVRGNHDFCNNADFKKKFIGISEYMEVDDNGRKIVLCHYPIVCFKNHHWGWYHLYGHVHTSFEYNMMENAKFQMEALYEKPCQMYNVGAMMPWMDYTPKTLDEIIAGYGGSAHG